MTDVNRLDWFRFSARDWLTAYSVRRMTPMQRGYYIQLLSESWEQSPRASLPVDQDEIAFLAGAKDWGEFIAQGGLYVMAQFIERDGRLYNQRLESEADHGSNWLKAKREAGRDGARKRWQTDSTPIAEPSQTNSTPNGQPMAKDSSVAKHSVAKQSGVNTFAAPAAENGLHDSLRTLVQKVWLGHNPDVPTCPWDGREGKRLKDLIGKTPRWSIEMYAKCLENYYASEGANNSVLPHQLIGDLPKYLNGPLDQYGHAKGQSNGRQKVSSAQQRADSIDATTRAAAERLGFAKPDSGISAHDPPVRRLRS